ncbi:hypothetical protein [Tenacibaculum maritimum]|uniref:hypothetical protein n=1 Tax=Tenacibaculum maritimum TaxID=107401 RepID=UPI001E4F5987|nr:hypothetical protein [Tenacibaculum maritimum]MCD9584527.1 hypothetical protein [Tenacibaculum maritimum]MCD9621355.1 hypothetical protein [Tenacibaculum maritimum]MCD9627644.1 hypothetical protein [Tenacibaculum maritimum]MCD9630981.1 hypothetical protein [Tenacibaculum maritimum]MCD9633190.1 hypothetical protein [Tenacibaculum maritimum]
MKKIILSIICMIAIQLSTQAQTTDFFPASNTIWIEDFSGYTADTGITTDNGAIINQGDYDASFSKWKINSNNVDLSRTLTASVKNLRAANVYAPSFQVANTGGDLEWESEEIDVTAFPLTYLSILLENNGNMSENEYIDVYWKIVGVGNYILIDDNNINHTLIGSSPDVCWNAIKIFKDLTVTNPGKVQIKVVFKSENSNNILKIKKVELLGRNN